MTSYQANFTNHHIRDHQVSFLFLRHSKLENTPKCPITFYLVHTTTPNYSRGTSKVQVFLFFYFVPYKKETKQEGAKSYMYRTSAYCIVQTLYHCLPEGRQKVKLVFQDGEFAFIHLMHVKWYAIDVL